ncbi:hypothetical protein K7395_11610 [Streptomyces filamentosus]|uniref:Uncharacterized protein n=2 Tax=Streptomyces filamentosus TaxID=67294 RepID=A0ABY4UZ94_STRFL|nr:MULTISPECIES: hypothetical protein [Streptomyces]MYR81167.1 hypothetical protein [Streptomyces sp. SID5466]USC47346.1 hypothetical protein K7395_11610 [Streptomyces filamentosus]
MTGNPAGRAAPDDVKKMSERQSEAFEHIVSAYTEYGKSNPARIPSEIRHNLANALTYYRSDVYDILGISVDFSAPEYSTTPNNIEIRSGTMTDFLEGLAENEAAFRLIRESIFEHADRQIKSLRGDDFARESKAEAGKPYVDNALGVARQSGAVTSILRKVRFQALKNQTKDDKSKLDSALGGDYMGYGFPRLEQLFRSRAENLHVPETGESKRRLEEILSTAREGHSG